MTYRDYETMEHKGYSFRVTFEHDDDRGPPWEDDCGRGIVSDWMPRYSNHTGRRDKRPGDRIIAEDRGGSVRYFDFAGTMRKARAEGWGLAPDALAQLRDRLKREPTKRQIIAESVEREFEFLRQWCNDQWHYVGVCVALLDAHGEETGYSDSLWGVETYADYHQKVARECMDNCLAERAEAIKMKAKETRERNYWAARGVETRA